MFKTFNIKQSLIIRCLVIKLCDRVIQHNFFFFFCRTSIVTGDIILPRLRTLLEGRPYITPQF